MTDIFEKVENFISENSGNLKVTVKATKNREKKITFKTRNFKRFLASFEIEKEEAIKAGSIGYMHRGLTLCSLPYKEVKDTGIYTKIIKDKMEYTKKNGNVTLRVLSPRDIGVPYGNIPRLIHMHLATEAVKTRSRQIFLGNRLSEFMNRLGFKMTGGEYGTITRLKDQVQRMFYSTITLNIETPGCIDGKHLPMMTGIQLLWNAKDPGKKLLWESSITLEHDYVKDLIEHPVPVDMRAVEALRGASLDLDIYYWLTHRMFYLSKPTVISYEQLQLQFGSDYKRIRKFKEKFLIALKNVKSIWKDLKISDEGDGLKLERSKLLISPRKR